MIADISSSLRWNLSLGAKFARVVPVQTTLVVVLTLVSQMSALLAFFLPLKVVILLGSDRVPSYIPDAVAAFGVDRLIVALAIATVAFFLLHLVAERIITLVTVSGSRRLLLKSQKMVLFEKQEQVAENAYERFSRTFAGGIFVVLALAVVAVVYTNMFWVVAGYASLTTILIVGLGSWSLTFRERLASDLSQTLKLGAAIGFLFGFAFLVTDFLVFDPPGVIIAIVSLLLARQIFNRISGIAQDLTALEGQRARYDALFFHGKPLSRQEPQAARTIWPLLERDTRDQWVSQLLRQRALKCEGPVRTVWQPMGISNIAALRVNDSEHRREFLVKLFDHNRRSMSLHETSLLSAPPNDLPAPKLLENAEIRHFSCLLYALPLGSPVIDPRRVRELTLSLRSLILEIELPTSLIAHYRRSHLLLWQRIDSAMLLRLRVAAGNPEQEQRVEDLVRCLPTLRRHLETLPLALLNPDVTQATIWVEEPEQKPLLLNWARWSIDPAGAGWGDREEQLEQLVAALEKAAPRRSCLSDVRPEQVQLAALTFSLEANLLRQQFPEALNLVARILELLDLLDAESRDSHSGSQ